MMALSRDMDMHGLRGRVRTNEPLSRHTAWAIGGPADRMYHPADLEDLCAFLKRLPDDEPLFWLGLGSNLLVRDGGIRGTVIHLGNTLSGQAVTSPLEVRSEAGVACPKVARFAARADLSGAEFMAGIPGTVGGALAMNAGAFGGETFDNREPRRDRDPWRRIAFATRQCVRDRLSPCCDTQERVVRGGALCTGGGFARGE